MASPLSERLQILENLLQTINSEFQQLKKELEATQTATVKESEISSLPKREFEADKQTMLSETFFRNRENLKLGHLPLKILRQRNQLLSQKVSLKKN